MPSRTSYRDSEPVAADADTRRTGVDTLDNIDLVGAGAGDRDGGIDAIVPDIREVAATEPKQVDEDVVRVSSAKDTADAIARSRRSLAEIEARAVLDARAASDERAAELAHWAADDPHLTDDVDQHNDAGAVLKFEPAEFRS